MGLLGSGHCIAMCGGISSALGLSQTQNKTGAVLYQVGRITTYTLAGAFFGLFGLWIPVEFALIMRLITAALLIGVALYLMGISQAIVLLETLGRPLWRALQPGIKQLGKPHANHQFWLAGLLWGWLPCGLVYSALAMAASASNPLISPLIMLSFGLGTLPSMLTVSFAGQQIALLGKRPAIRIMGGVLLLLMAFWMLYNTGQSLFGQTAHHG